MPTRVTSARDSADFGNGANKADKVERDGGGFQLRWSDGVNVWDQRCDVEMSGPVPKRKIDDVTAPSDGPISAGAKLVHVKNYDALPSGFTGVLTVDGDGHCFPRTIEKATSMRTKAARLVVLGDNGAQVKVAVRSCRTSTAAVLAKKKEQLLPLWLGEAPHAGRWAH